MNSFRIHEKALINLDRIKELCIEIYGQHDFEVELSPYSDGSRTKYYELHLVKSST